MTECVINRYKYVFIGDVLPPPKKKKTCQRCSQSIWFEPGGVDQDWDFWFLTFMWV